MQSATYPLTTTSFAFRSLDDSEEKRSSEENRRIQRWALNEKTAEAPLTQTCIPTSFGIATRPVGTYNLELEDAIDGRRQRKYDFVPEYLQDKVPRKPSLDALDPALPVCEDNTFLQPINTHLEFGTRGALVTDIQVTRNDTLGLPNAPNAYVFGNRPQVGVNNRQVIKDVVAQNQGRLKLSAEAVRRKATGVAW